jgi:hypothetical protein
MLINYSFPFWFVPFIMLCSFLAIRIRRHVFHHHRRRELKVPSYVRIIAPLPGEEGRCLLIWADQESDEYRVGLRDDGLVRSYTRAELEEWRE